MKEAKNTLTDTLYKVVNLELIELNSPEKDDYEYRYFMF